LGNPAPLSADGSNRFRPFPFALECRAQIEATTNHNLADADHLRTSANQLAMKGHAVRETHQEETAVLILVAVAQYQLTNLKHAAGTRRSVRKRDPMFFDFRDPN
jgi:hypothetical protein